MCSSTIKVLVVDDHQLMIEGLKSLLEEENDIAFVAGASSVKEALQLLETTPIDVILMDINMPEESGIEATTQIKKKYPEIKVIALTMHDDISIITRMVEAGASGYVLKRTQMSEVTEAIRIVHNKGKYLSINTQQIIMDNLNSSIDPNTQKDDTKTILSSRESEVLQLIAKEYSNEMIAEKLFISERTVEAHRRNIFIKTKTKSIVGLMKYAINHGLIEIDPDEKS